MSWRSIFVTLLFATLTSVLGATVFYPIIFDASKTLEGYYLPLEPCVLIAVFSAVVGSIAYGLQNRFFPVSEAVEVANEDVACSHQSQPEA